MVQTSIKRFSDINSSNIEVQFHSTLLNVMTFHKVLSVFEFFGFFSKQTLFSITLRIVLLLSVCHMFHYIWVHIFHRPGTDPVLVAVSSLSYVILSLSTILTSVVPILSSKTNKAILLKLQAFDSICLSFKCDLNARFQTKKYLSLASLILLLELLPWIIHFMLSKKNTLFDCIMETYVYIFLFSTEICFILLVDLINVRLRALKSLSKNPGCKSIQLMLHSKLHTIAAMVNTSFGIVVSTILVGSCIDITVCAFWSFCALHDSHYYIAISKLKEKDRKDTVKVILIFLIFVSRVCNVYIARYHLDSSCFPSMSDDHGP